MSTQARAGFAGWLLGREAGFVAQVVSRVQVLVRFAAQRWVGSSDPTGKRICEPCAQGNHHGCVTGKQPLEPAWCQCTINPDTGEDEEGLR